MLTMLISFSSIGVAVAQKFGYLTEHGVPVNAQQQHLHTIRDDDVYHGR